jgi:hypothetical protein
LSQKQITGTQKQNFSRIANSKSFEIFHKVLSSEQTVYYSTKLKFAKTKKKVKDHHQPRKRRRRSTMLLLLFLAQAPGTPHNYLSIQLVSPPQKKPSNKQFFQNLEGKNTNRQKLREREMARKEIQDGDQKLSAHTHTHTHTQ